LSCSIVFVAGLDMIAKGLSVCGSGPKWSRQQKVCPFVEIHRFRRWFQCLQEMPTGKVCPFVCVHKRSVSLSCSIVFVAGFSTSRIGLSVCGSGPKWSRQQKVCPFVEIHRFRRWFQCLQERSARLWVLYVSTRGLSLCRVPSRLSPETAPEAAANSHAHPQKVCPFVGRPVCVIASDLVRKRSVLLSRSCPFVAIHRFDRWFQYVQKRSVRLWVRPQVVSSTKGLSLCGNPSFSSLVSVPTGKVCPFV
jgi:hypothetical protein